MSDFMLKFPLLSGGKPRGVNSSGIAAFKGDPAKSLSREWAQNAIDAFHKTFPIEMDFELKWFPISDLPGFDELKKSVEACATYWPKQKQEQHFCGQVLDKFTEQIPVLVITDRGTTGLRGGDNDQSGQWFGLVEGTETSVGDESRGGSFGIGKNAAFAASVFQTVYFSTHSVDNEFAFKGASVLMTHRNGEGEETQADGSIGIFCNETGRIKTLRDPEKIPDQFKRTEPGLSTYIPGYKPIYKNPETWKDELVMSLLSNFWPAVHFEKATFRIQDILIDKQTLPKLMERYAEKCDGDNETFQAHLYYRVFSSSNRRVFHGTLKYLKEVTLYAVKEDDLPQMPNNVVITRQTGMIIKYDRFNGLGFPFAGLLQCENVTGNGLLRDMEPPQHNDLHPKQLEAFDGKKVLDELHKWIREQLKEFSPKLDKDEYELPDTAQYFPMPDEEDTPLEAQGKDAHENYNQRPVEKEIEVKRISTLQPAINNGSDNTEGDTGQEERGEPDPADVGDGKRTGGEPKTSSGRDGELKRVSTRGCSLGDGRYRLIIRSESDFMGTVRVFASGDSVREPLTVLVAKTHSGKAATLSAGHISGITFSSLEPVTLEIEVEEKERYALDVEVRDEA